MLDLLIFQKKVFHNSVKLSFNSSTPGVIKKAIPS